MVFPKLYLLLIIVLPVVSLWVRTLIHEVIYIVFVVLAATLLILFHDGKTDTYGGLFLIAWAAYRSTLAYRKYRVNKRVEEK